MQRPLELCSWKDREALPPVGKEYQQGYKRLNDRLPKSICTTFRRICQHNFAKQSTTVAAMSTWPMISIPAAVAIVLQHTRVLPVEHVPVAQALGRILAASVTAPDSLPPFPASIKDGYAVVAADGEGSYPVVGESRAGTLDDIHLAPGQVAYITTGAPVPPGADAVVQVEDTQLLPPPEVAQAPHDPTTPTAVTDGPTGGEGPQGRKRVRILKAAKPGQDIRTIGSDIQQGAEVLAAGECVGVAEVGILATVGAVEQLPVFRVPHVGVLSTGDEVVDPSTRQLGPGQIRDANRSMLLAAARQAGCKVTDLGVARDVEGHLEGCVQAAVQQQVDILITSGGVSMGDRDLLKPLLQRAGTVHFGRVLMKPGKPLTFATLEVPAGGQGQGEGQGEDGHGCPGRQLLVFGLPGEGAQAHDLCFEKHRIRQILAHKVEEEADAAL
ncbi:hypothetical protein QJQ45_015012 [Haematococcus lacustris]|nr:hypothetical protein QJQ45_015012 [Haematococcus lacustris]